MLPRDDGGGAFVVTSAQRAADLDAKGVFILGSGDSTEDALVSQKNDFSSTSRAFRDAGPAAFAEAGIPHADDDHLTVYDAFAHVPLDGLADLGFVGPGEAADFVREGNTARGGSLPMNRGRPALCYTHTGM